MAEEIGRRHFLGLVTASLAGCALAPETTEPHPGQTERTPEQLLVLQCVSQINNMLMNRANSRHDSPHFFDGAEPLLNKIKDAKPNPHEEYAAFEEQKLRYAAILASRAVEQGAGSLVVHIATVFPEITVSRIKIPEMGYYDLGDDLANNYGKTRRPPDEPLTAVRTQLVDISAQYQKETNLFDDGATPDRKPSWQELLEPHPDMIKNPNSLNQKGPSRT